jgi:hypothetical protein
MNLEQIVKETVAKIVAEKQGKDLTGDGKIDSADYLKARSNAIEKAKGLDEAANKIKIIHKGPSDDPTSNYMQYELLFNGEEINAEEFAKGWKVIRYDDWDDEYKDIRNPKKQEIIDFINAYNEKNLDNIKEEEDHEVSMAQSSLNSILRSAMELKAKIGNQEIDIPAWIQDHITNSENFIDQASQGYHEYSNGGEHGEMDEARFEKGTDIGGKGFEFKDIAKKAAKQYGSKEAGQRVAGAIMKKVLNKEEEGYDFIRSAIESASGDKLKPGNDIDDYERPVYFSSSDDYVSYFIGMGGEFEGKIYKYNAETGERYPIGDLKHYGDGQNHAADDDMHEAQNISDDELAQLQSTADDTSKMPAERDAARNKIYASRAKKEQQELDEWTISRWQHYAGIK